MSLSSLVGRRLLPLGLSLCALACRAAPSRARSTPTVNPAPMLAASALAPRPEAVASADAWAALGEKQGGAEGSRHLLDAARLRNRIFRLDHRTVDALEAIELYRQAARSDGRVRCAALTASALLEGELRADPSVTFQAVYRAAHDALADSSCRERAESVLQTLDAYHPPDAALDGSAPHLAPLASSATAQHSLNADSMLVPGLPRAPRGPLRVTEIKRYGAPDAARIVIFVTEPTQYKLGFLSADSKKPRLYLDIAGASYHGPTLFEVGGLVERVRVGAASNRTRVVLDLNEAAKPRIFYVPEPFRLVIDVAKDAPRSVDESRRGPRAVRRVVLDPGHGGHDPGASGPSGLREKDVTLDIAQRAAPLIARELGISTLLTRDGDEYVALDERTARANAFQADLFVSIHCNASEDGAGRGVMTFVLDDSRDATSARVAARENDSSTEAAAELATAFREGQGTGRSNHFAELLQRAAIASLAPSYADIPDSGIKRAGFYVLAGAQMPAVLFETSFISSPSGESRFNTGDFRQKISDAIVNAVRAYRDGL